MPLLVRDRKAALRLLVVLREALQLPHRLARVDGEQELDVALRVLVAGEHPRVRRQAPQLRQRGVHLAGRALEELAAPADEQRVAREHGAFVRGLVLHEVADRVLRVARRVQRRDGDVFPDGEDLAVLRRAGHGGAVLAADDGELGGEGGEELFVPARVVVVVVRVDDGGEVDGAVHALLQHGEHLAGVGGVDDHGVVGGLVADEVGVVVRRADPHGDAFDLHGADLLRAEEGC